MADGHFQESERFSSPSSFSPEISPADEYFVVCPRCIQSTDSLKCYDVPYVLFLFGYVACSTEKVVACPDCMRAFLSKRLLISIPLANLAFPFVFMIYIGHWLGAISRGHSFLAEADAHRMTSVEQSARLEAAIPTRRRSRKEAVVLCVIVLLIAGLWGGGYLLSRKDSEPSVEGRTTTEWIQELESLDVEARLKAITILGSMGTEGKKAVPALQAITVHDENQWVRREGYRSLRAIDPNSVNGLPLPKIRVPGIAD